MAKEVCDILGFDRAFNAVKRLDDDEKSLTPRRSLGLKPGRDMLLINESGLYNLIMRSRRPEAQAFRKWVTGEVPRQAQGNLRRLLIASLAAHDPQGRE